VIVIGLVSDLSFIADDWELLVKRHGFSAGTYLDPFHEHIVLGPAVVFKALLAVFGMGSALPFFTVSTAVFLLSAVLLFVYLRPRVGDWLALIAAVLILFLGAAFEDLFWAFQVGFFTSMAAGLGMLIALDRGDEAGDRAACALLVVSLAFSSLGLIFAVGALVDLALSRRPGAGRRYVALLPLGLYALWWLGWGHNAESNLSLHNVEHLPGFVFDSAAAGLTSLFGLASGNANDPHPHLIWGKILLVLAVALGAARLLRQRRLSRGLAIALALGLAFWILAGLEQTPDRLPTSSRYQYPSAVFLLLIAAETLRGMRIPRLAVMAAAVVSGAAVVGGLSLLYREHREHWKPATDHIRSYLAVVEIAGEGARPGFLVSFPPAVEIPDRTYLAAVRAHGSPAFSESELEARPDAIRVNADRTLAAVLGLALSPASGAGPTARCRTVRATANGHTGLTLRRGALLSDEGGPGVEVLLGRFSDGLPVDLGALAPGATSALAIPADSSTRPWRLGLRGSGPVRLCPPAST
jgi:hypothetical protein